MNIIRRDEVLDDLINLSYYIAQRDEQAANRFLDAVTESFERLAQMPFIGVERTFRNPRLTSVRMWFVQGFERHLIFYRVLDDEIEVLRVLHAARDIEGVFNDEQNQ